MEGGMPMQVHNTLYVGGEQIVFLRVIEHFLLMTGAFNYRWEKEPTVNYRHSVQRGRKDCKLLRHNIKGVSTFMQRYLLKSNFSSSEQLHMHHFSAESHVINAAVGMCNAYLAS